MVWGLVGSLASSVGSSLFNNFLGQNSAKTQYKNQSKLNKQSYNYSKKLQAQQNKYNTQMFNRSAELAASAHQIEVNDMRNAGLNPILSATGGSGATAVAPMSSGSATISGGSASAPEPGKVDLLEAYNSAKQIKNETRMTNSNIRKNDFDNNLMNENASYVKEQNRQFKEYNPKVQQKQLEKLDEEITNLKSNSAKVMNDIYNSNRLTDSQIDVNSANAWRARHQALGYSESSSVTNNNSRGFGMGSIGIGAKGINLPSFNANRDKGTSRSYSRSW